MSGFIVIRDTREKFGQGWTFKPIPNEPFNGMEVAKLDTGDYSIKGFENIVSLERKGKVSELAHNVVQDRFYRELVRLDKIAHPFLVLEFTLDQLLRYPYDMPDPGRIRTNGKFLLKQLTEIQIQYRTKVIFAGNKGLTVAMSIFKRIWEQYGDRNSTRKAT